MGWRIVEIETDEYMQLYLNNLQIIRQNERILINIPEIDTLIVHNTRATVSVNLLNALAAENVSVTFMNASHEPQSHLVPVSGHHASLKVLEKQLAWTNQYKGLLWKTVVQNKIISQQALLRRLKLDGQLAFFSALVETVREFDVSNREGHAAKVYWHEQYGVDFVRDQGCLSAPLINSMLNYGYAILRSAVIRAILKKGLDARISLFHRSPTNFFALASDLMEPFRPLVDELVYKHKDEKLFTYDLRDMLVGILECHVFVEGVKFALPMACDKVVDSIISGKGWAWVSLWG